LIEDAVIMMKNFFKKNIELKLFQIVFVGVVLFPVFLNAQTIEFTKQTGDDNPLNNADVSSSISSITVDIDNDGDFDLFTGNALGTIQYFKNISTVEAPNVFEEQLDAANPFNGVDVGSKSVPVFVDIDNNGTLDCFIGSTNSIHYYKNTGSISNPIFVVQSSGSNPLSAVTSSGSRSYLPSFVDIDHDSDMDCFLGYVDYDTEDSHAILYYKNEGTNTVPSFVMQNGSDNPFESFNELYPQPIFLDIDSDNDFDAFIGMGNGEFYFYENTSEPVGLATEKVEVNNINMYPNPASSSVNFYIENKDLQIRIFSLSGIEVYNGVLTNDRNNIDVSNFSSGIYIVIMDNGKTQITQKLVINK
jgi:hypothetical protein